MPIVDRLEYPKKYKLKGTLLLLVALAALGGIVYLRLSNEARAKRVVVHSVGFGEFDTNFIRINYEIENTGRKAEEVDLLAKVYDSAGAEIASIFFRTEVKAQTREYQSKYIDKLYRPLRSGEQPHKVTVNRQQRGLLGY
jgi:predicted Zn-dependent peptidase